MKDIRYCPECSEPILADARTCPHCNADVEYDVDRAGVWRKLQKGLAEAAADKYEVEGLIGYGGMAGVYLARDLGLNRHVALKLISPAVLMDPTMVRRFRQEAQTMAQLNHRHIVPVYDIREDGDLLYIVMQYVSGRTLSEVVTDATGGLPPELVATWMVQICDALAHAHGRGTPVIHRDIKPSNILLDDSGQALLTDFGIAKVQGEAGLTRTGHLIGTPAYMSPEQCRGDSVTVASDQYSLGTVAYELLAGTPPFQGPTLMVLQSHSGKEPEKLTRTRPECPPRLASVVERMLAKSPDARWADMTQVTEEFRKSVDRLVPASELRTWGRKVKDIGLGTPLGPLTPGTREQLLVRLLDSDGSELVGRRVRWSSTNKKVASVTFEGVVSAHAVGKAVIVGRSGGAITTIEVEVVLPEAHRIEVQPARLEIHAGEGVDLSVRAFLADGTEVAAGPVDWEVDAPGVVTMDSSTAVGVAPGEALVTARSGSLRCVVPVVVRPVPVTEVLVDDVPPLEAGDHQMISWRAVGPGGEELVDRAPTWSSSDPAVATVDQSGKLFAIAPGEAQILVAVEGVERRLDVAVTVPAVVGLTSSVSSVEMSHGERQRVEAHPVDRMGRHLVGRSIVWETSDPDVARVSSDGELIGQAPGTASVTARCEGHSTEILVVVREASATVVIPRPPAPPPDHTQVLSGLDWGEANLDLAPPGGSAPPPGPPVVQGPEAAPPPREVPPAEETLAVPVPGLGKVGRIDTPEPPAPARTPSQGTGQPGLPREVDGGAPPDDVSESPAWTRPAVGIGIVLAAVVGWLLWPDGEPSLQPLTVGISPADTTLVQGSTFQLRSDVSAGQLADRQARWTSSDPSVATVTPTGLVEAVGPGNAALSLTGVDLVTDGPRTISVVLPGDELATDEAADPVFTQLVFDPFPSTLEVDGTVEIAAWLVGPESGRVAATDLSWTSSNTGILQGAGGGRFRAVGPGAVTIVATHEASNLTQQAPLTVSTPSRTTAPPPTRPDPEPSQPIPVRIAIQDDGGTLEPGESRGLSAQLVDEAGRPVPGAGVLWSSTAPDRITVGSEGRIAAVAAGTSWVVASSGALRDSVLVTVAEPAPPPPPEPAALSVTQVSALIDQISGLLESQRHADVLSLVPAGERGAHERYVSFLQDGRLWFEGGAQDVRLDGSTATFTVSVRSRTSFGGTRDGEMRFAADLDSSNGTWRIVRLVPAQGSSPP